MFFLAGHFPFEKLYKLTGRFYLANKVGVVPKIKRDYCNVTPPFISYLGGAERDRTADLVNAIHALSQLSYGPLLVSNN